MGFMDNTIAMEQSKQTKLLKEILDELRKLNKEMVNVTTK